jgi:hydrogenase maturation protein HypF
VRFLAASARRAREQTGLNVVALSGGCFANRWISSRLAAELTRDEFEVLTHRTVPCNDGGVALGQSAVAAARAATTRRAEQSTHLET